MDIRQKAARLVMTSLVQRDPAKAPDERRRLERGVSEIGIGGYCIFGGEVASTRDLTRELAALAPHRLLVASDLERGLGQQLLGGTVFPSPMAVGATGRPDLAYAVGLATGREARAAGIDLVFAPVADVLTEPANPIIGSRAYGGDPVAVASFVSSFVEGCQDGGAAATAKHFPGHGDTGEDSHIDLPLVRASREVLERRELVPFRAAVGAGARAVMTAHVAYPSLTGSDVPATLSPEVTRRLLRERLGFTGVVVTDALVMGAIAREHGAGEAAVLALRAGADVLLMPADPAEAVDGVLSAVRAGTMTEARIDESLARIDALAAWLAAPVARPARMERARPDVQALLIENPVGDAATMAGRFPRHRRLAARVGRAAVTVLGEVRFAPIGEGPPSAESVAFFALIDSTRPADVTPFSASVNARMPGTRVGMIGDDAAPDVVVRLVEEASRAERTVVAIFDEPAAWRGRPGPSDALIEIVTRLLAARPGAVVVGFGGPILATIVPRAPSLLCCYDTTPTMQEAAVAVLFGEARPSGRLPVNVVAARPRGDA